LVAKPNENGWIRKAQERTLASTEQKVTFDVPPSVVIKIAVFWDMTPCSMFVDYRLK